MRAVYIVPNLKFTFPNNSYYYLPCKIIRAYTTVTFYTFGRGKSCRTCELGSLPITNLLSVGTESADRRIICRLAC